MFSALGVNLDIVVFALIAVIILVLAMLGVVVHHQIKLARIMKNCPSGRLDETIISYYDRVAALTQEVQKQSERFVKYENNASLYIQKVGCIRYNAFSGSGSDLSYSIAMLDASDTGFVLTGIYGRDNANTYMKPITEGNSHINLSEEEKRAILIAKNNFDTKHMN